MKKIIVLFLMLVCMGACASNTTSLSNNPALYYPQCYLPLQQARKLDSRARDIAEGAGKGLLVGTLAGLAGGAVSALFSGDPLNIVSGAAIGAASGAVGGGIYGGMQDNQAQKNALLAKWYQEIDGDISGLGFNGAAATVSIQCYDRRFNEVQKELDDHIINLSTAQPRLTEIELGRQEAYQLLQQSQNGG